MGRREPVRRVTEVPPGLRDRQRVRMRFLAAVLPPVAAIVGNWHADRCGGRPRCCRLPAAT
jgi:hypothetical protein